MKLIENSYQFAWRSLAICLLATTLPLCSAGKGSHLRCSACLALVEELGYMISDVDPKKKIQVGSYRIDSNGNQDLREIPYARSDLHLTEIGETVCRRMNNYGETTSTAKKTIVRIASFPGQHVSTANVDTDRDIQKRLEHHCNAILEDHEEEIMKLFKDAGSGDLYEKNEQICIDLLGVCKAEDTQARIWAQAEAVMKGMQEHGDKTLEPSEDTEDEDEEETDEELNEEEEKDEKLKTDGLENLDTASQDTEKKDEL